MVSARFIHRYSICALAVGMTWVSPLAAQRGRVAARVTAPPIEVSAGVVLGPIHVMVDAWDDGRHGDGWRAERERRYRRDIARAYERRDRDLAKADRKYRERMRKAERRYRRDGNPYRFERDRLEAREKHERDSYEAERRFREDVEKARRKRYRR